MIGSARGCVGVRRARETNRHGTCHAVLALALWSVLNTSAMRSRSA